MNRYSHLSKEELLKIIEKQEKELDLKKYGLVWDREREPEQVVLDCENNLPILKRIKERQIKTDRSAERNAAKKPASIGAHSAGGLYQRG